VLKDHGFSVPELTGNNQSRTSSVILFGGKDFKAGSDNSTKKREVNAVDMNDMRSVVSGRTNKSKNYHKEVLCP
jgi:hypothetical protein